ncbi:N-acetylmuramoyl-L-alanine amidase [Cohnella sp. GCM10027633]|uniref:N-acetylmuramoyl-L-alanine amidase family protein n=1 Tax=unclassified Cohnella TaxID=2636738 RepID=UPI0036404EB8
MNREYRRSRKPAKLVVLVMAFVLLFSVWSLSTNALSRSAKNDAEPVPIVTSADASVQQGDKGGTAAGEDRVRRIVIDAGHGGVDPGAEGVSGNYEKAVTLFIAAKVADILSQDPAYEVTMTREDDLFLPLEDRPAIANGIGADAFVSIHGNTYTDPSVSGTETYYYKEDSIALSESVHRRLIDALGFRDRGVKQEEWKVLTHSDVPAVLLELGYLTNANEEAALLDDDTQTRTAQAIVDGLKDYFAGMDGVVRG